VLATFLLVESTWLVVAFVATAAAATYARLAHRAPRGTTAAGSELRGGEERMLSTNGSGAPETRWGALWIVLVVGLAALGLGAMLVVAKTPVAHALLLAFSAAAALMLSVESYRGRWMKLGLGRAVFCTLARVAACLVILLMIGRPRWDWVIVEWEKPLLTVLLDQTKSMSIRDGESPEAPSRAALVNQAIANSRTWIDRLNALYEVRVFGVGQGGELLDDWRVLPRAPVSAIATALRQAGQSRSAHGEPPVAVLLISDGAENVVNPRVVREVATELAAQRTAMLAAGAGPAAELAPAVILDPLIVPGRIGSRDRVRVPVTAQVTGCGGRTVHVALLWGNEQAAERQVRIEQAAQRIGTEFEIRPPSVGLHRLTARVTLPPDLGGESFETSIIVDVRDDRIRVLMLEGQPRNELAFAKRAVGGDPRFEVTQRLLLGETTPQGTAAPPAPPRWADFDVVVLGDVPAKQLGFDALADLADAVRQRGVGLLMAGGRDFYHEGYYSRSELQDVSPVGFKLSRPADDYRPRFQPTELGRRHPILLGVGEGAVAVGGEHQASEIWDRLPPLGGAARFGAPKPLAAILATDSSGRPLLAALDVGRGRSVAAGWDSTWPWALSSEEGLAAHGKLWRQMVAWLANRRPLAWVVTDRSSYVRAALAGEQQRIQIRAGLSGVEMPSEGVRRAEFKASLELRFVRGDADTQFGSQGEQPTSAAASQPTVAPPQGVWAIPLERRGGEWQAELPQDLQTQAWLTSGTYELVFVVEQMTAGDSSATPLPAEIGDGERLILTARTGFTVSATDLELLEPTANLALMREAAARTESVGGAYYPIDQLPDAVRRLADDDRRRRIERPAAYDLIRQQPWLLLALATSALVLEWLVRKRGGMA
jgi:hypothetical protein